LPGHRLLVALPLLAVALAPAGAQAVEPPDDPLFTYQRHLSAIQIRDAWEVSRGAGATVAVLDTGVAYENRGRHRRAPDLAGTSFARGWDFVDGDAHPNDEPVGVRPGHGTHIAGIIAQTTGNGLGTAGVAPSARIMPIRVLRPNVTGSARTIARGLRFAADHGADVTNLSLAGPRSAPVLEDAIEYAASKGVTVVASTGNGGRRSVGYPAADPRVIAVGAVNRARQRAAYSNYGSELDIVAPAGDTQAIELGDGSEDGVLQQTLLGGPSRFCFCFMASTSAAAAQVSGVAALVVGSGRARTPAGVRLALLSSARDLGRPGRDDIYGAGLVQAAAAVGRNGSAGDAAAGSPGNGGPGWYGWVALALLAGAAGVIAVRLLRRRRRVAGR
jgi:serine protease